MLLIQCILSLKQMVPSDEGSVDHPILRFWIVFANVKENFSRTHHYHHLCVELRATTACSVSKLWFERKKNIEISKPRTFWECRQYEKIMCIYHIYFVTLYEIYVFHFLPSIHNDRGAKRARIKDLAIQTCQYSPYKVFIWLMIQDDVLKEEYESLVVSFEHSLNN